ncbi:hypothetical protein MMC30_001104 [Trapelia coarctata]|nr:hypothetical protein [Trapelia coarctata]
MNGDTIALDTAYNEGHRVKRIKIEQVKAGNKGISRTSGLARLSQNGNTNGDNMEVVETMEVDAVGKATPAGVNMGTALTQAARAVRADTSSASTRETPVISSHDSPRLGNPDKQDSSTPTPFNVDLSTAPSDPRELAWWVAQQVTHFYQDGSESPAADLDDQSRRILSHPPGVHARHSDAELEPEQIAKKKKLREEARERKKQWRESNAQKNKDNDLRCRINRLAKSKFGVAPSTEKSAYIEAEFNKRRNKRERKQRARAIAAGEAPSSAIAPELRDRIFSSASLNIPKEVETIGILLLNALFGGGNNSDEGQTAEAAKALGAAIKEMSPSPQVFIEAFKLMAKNSELMHGINAKMHYDGQDDEPMSGDDNGIQPLQTTRTRSASASSQGSALNHQSQEKIWALNAATALLNQISDTKVYASPYSNPPPPPPAAAASTDTYKSPYSNPPPAPAVPSTSRNGHEPNKTNGTGPPSDSKQAGDGHGLDQSQIDALLALANGGSLTDDEDDKTIADPDEIGGRQLETPGSPQTDNDIAATVQQIINQLTTDPKEGQSTAGKQEQAATLQSLWTQAGVVINTIIPAAQSHATSQLYAHLSSQAKSNAPGGTIPAHAGVYGNPTQIQHRSIADPGISGPSFAQHYPIPPSVGSNPRVQVFGLPVRHRNPEELKKIKTYGFPPLPGSRPGAKRT